jgi:hypothetical protein
MGIDKGKDTMEAYFQRHGAENDRERELEKAEGLSVLWLPPRPKK